MAYKNIGIKFIAVFLAFLTFISSAAVGAAEMTARLKSCLEKDHLYYVLVPGLLGKSNLKSRDDQYIAFSGVIRYNSVSKNHKTVTVYGDSSDTVGVEVDTSDSSVLNIAGSLKLGDRVTVYGQVDGNEVDAEHIRVNMEKEPTVLSFVFYDGKEYDEASVSDLARDGHVSLRIPSAWENEFVKGRLTNNDVNGYQFFLNAIYPQNRDYPENFYVFYFNYETYLDKPPARPTSGDHKDLEKLVVKNIVQDLSGDFKIDISTLKLGNGNQFDYCSMVYQPKDDNDYRLEFIFKPDSKGFVCMLYLYYPNDFGVNHLQDVAYVVNTLTS